MSTRFPPPSSSASKRTARSAIGYMSASALAPRRLRPRPPACTASRTPPNDLGGMPDILHFSQITPEHADLVGGKGLSLGLTACAGLPVPPGFCVTSTAYRRLLSDDPRIDPPLGTSLRD